VAKGRKTVHADKIGEGPSTVLIARAAPVLFFLGDFVLSAAARVWENEKHARFANSAKHAAPRTSTAKAQAKCKRQCDSPAHPLINQSDHEGDAIFSSCDCDVKFC
jgi:hypothetical protein